MSASVHTAVVESPSYGPTYLEATSWNSLKDLVRATLKRQLRIDSYGHADLFRGHDCRVWVDDDDQGKGVLGTDGYPDARCSARSVGCSPDPKFTWEAYG